ncbi:MAG: hypothetical protein RLN99_14705 [Kiloniellaceae bacterium]
MPAPRADAIPRDLIFIRASHARLTKGVSPRRDAAAAICNAALADCPIGALQIVGTAAFRRAGLPGRPSGRVALDGICLAWHASCSYSGEPFHPGVGSMREQAQLSLMCRRRVGVGEGAGERQQLSLVGLSQDGILRMGCLGELGNQVIGLGDGEIGGVDLESWMASCSEPYLGYMVVFAADAGLLKFGFRTTWAIMRCDATLLCVDVPVETNGGSDLRDMEQAVRAVGAAIAAKAEFHSVIVCSPVPPGTTMGFIVPLLEEASGGRLGEDFGIAVWPLALSEGHAVEDFFAQTRVIYAASDRATARCLAGLLSDLDCMLVETGFAAAELRNFTAWAWKGLQAGFEAELRDLCAALDIAEVDAVLDREPVPMAKGACLRTGEAARALGFFAESLCIAAPTLIGLGGGTPQQLHAAGEPLRRLH